MVNVVSLSTAWNGRDETGARGWVRPAALSIGILAACAMSGCDSDQPTISEPRPIQCSSDTGSGPDLEIYDFGGYVDCPDVVSPLAGAEQGRAVVENQVGLYLGSTLTLRTSIAGIGEFTDVPVVVTVGGVLLSTGNASFSPPSGCPNVYSRSAVWFAQKFVAPDTGTYRFRVSVDPANSISELFEDNNADSMLVRVVYGDAWAWGISTEDFGPAGPDTFRVGDRVPLTASAVIQGNLSQVRMVLDQGGTVLLDDTRPFIDECRWDPFVKYPPVTWTTQTPGSYVFNIRLEVSGTLKETNFANNVFSRVLTIIP